jgi:hypothetical protein
MAAELIQTTHGEMDVALLTKKDGVLENDHEITTWVEYYLGEELVHRSVHVQLKTWPDGLGAIVADLNS